MRGPVAAAGLAAIALSACSGQTATGSNGKICADFKTKAAPTAGLSADAAAVDECTRRWAYSLASSRDDAGTVAEAAAAACQTHLARWNQAALSQPAAGDAQASLITGEPTTPLAEHNNFTHARALFYVVQARAGNCAPPPAKDGVPEGVS